MVVALTCSSGFWPHESLIAGPEVTVEEAVRGDVAGIAVAVRRGHADRRGERDGGRCVGCPGVAVAVGRRVPEPVGHRRETTHRELFRRGATIVSSLKTYSHTLVVTGVVLPVVEYWTAEPGGPETSAKCSIP